MTIIINEQQIRDRIPASANVEMSLLRPNVILYQETRLTEIMGSRFYDDIVAKYLTQTLNPDEQSLLINYIHPTIVYGGLKISIPFLWSQVSNRGIVQQSGDFVNPASDSAFRALRDSVSVSLDHYERKLVKYLELTKNTLWPLWGNNVSNVQQPESQSSNDFGMVLDYFKSDGKCNKKL